MSAPTDFTDYLGKLHRLAEGALTTIARREAEEHPLGRPRGSANGPPGEQFWTGYRQAVEDMAAHAGEEPWLKT